MGGWHLDSIGSGAIAIAAALMLYQFLINWGFEFKYPILRSTTKSFSSSLESAIPAGFMIFLFYSITCYLILFGLARPLIPGTTISLDPFNAAVVGIMLVGIIRFLTLRNSVDTSRTLLNSLVIAAGFAFFLTLEFPDVVSKAVFAIAQSPETTLILPFVIIIFAVIVELAWLILDVYILNGKRKVQPSFVDALQDTEATELIGYSREQIHQAYLDAIVEVAREEPIWEIRWLTSKGAKPDFYEHLIENVAKRIACDSGRTTNFHNFNDIPISEQNKCKQLAAQLLEHQGQFLIEQKAQRGIEDFKSAMGFEPGVITEAPNVRFMIINRRILVMSWSAHPRRAGWIRGLDFRSTMYDITRSSARINYYRGLFEMYWNQHQKSHSRALLHGLDSYCAITLDTLISRSAPWTPNELHLHINERGVPLKLEDVKVALIKLNDQTLVTLIAENGINKYRRNKHSFEWQNFWFRLREKPFH